MLDKDEPLILELLLTLLDWLEEDALDRLEEDILDEELELKDMDWDE